MFLSEQLHFKFPVFKRQKYGGNAAEIVLAEDCGTEIAIFNVSLQNTKDEKPITYLQDFLKDEEQGRRQSNVDWTFV